MIIDVVESFGGENLYFVGEGEIEKPVFVSHPIGTFVAISSSGAAGKKHIFTAGEVSHIPNMETIETPDWLKSMLHNKIMRIGCRQDCCQAEKLKGTT